MRNDPESGLAGTPSDAAPPVLATGDGGISTLFMSMAQRHPDGDDADYLRWHTLDHRPEQHRLGALRASLRVVSTPACRQARAAEVGIFAAVDHVMTYFFIDQDGLAGFRDLAVALRDAGRSPFILPPVQRGVYTVAHRVAAARVKTGADVLPWLPVRGVYILIERGEALPQSLAEEPGIAGAWSAVAVPGEESGIAAPQRLTLCFLDGDPLEVAPGLRPALDRRCQQGDVQPLLAAPFYCIVPYEWGRYLP